MIVCPPRNCVSHRGSARSGDYRTDRKGILMPASGELIRMMNYVDDIAATLRRVNASLYLLSEEDKKRLAEYMRKSDPNFLTLVELLEKAE